ncbi:lytic murein transglycosylase B [Castellaniella sp. GW247-6E4]|uniref:lytic murein transglycosylase B n=1 Tax=Castellaniella sp. GW247-6E4 TaxID=3140380 RepID=UPI0033159102
MSRPVRILQVAAASLALAGCATSGTADPSAPVAPSAPHSDTAAAIPNSPPKRAPVPARGDFVAANGALQPDVAAFAREVSAAHGIALPEVEALLLEARFDATAARLMTPSGKRIRRAWLSYRQRHVDPIRIREGVAFWNANRADLDRASRRYGVPPSIIVAIIGIETVYGRYTGDHRVLDTLATLGFRYPDPGRPERARMFRQQLEDLIVLDAQGLLDARSAEGSFAGAMGLPQFMPGSLMRYAADGDADGRIDLMGSKADAIASVGLFLQEHGWVRDVPVFAPVALPARADALVQDGLSPTTDWPSLRAAGARALPGGGTAWQAAALGVIDLRDEVRGVNEYRSATPNFFALTHYNRSYFYAASVADLAHEIADRVGYGDPNRLDH